MHAQVGKCSLGTSSASLARWGWRRPRSGVVVCLQSLAPYVRSRVRGWPATPQTWQWLSQRQSAGHATVCFSEVIQPPSVQQDACQSSLFVRAD